MAQVLFLLAAGLTIFGLLAGGILSLVFKASFKRCFAGSVLAAILLLFVEIIL